MKSKSTITECLGISDSWWDTGLEMVVEALEKETKVSDVVERLVKEGREEELGESNVPSSIYEKKLVMLGMMLGEKMAQKIIEERLSGGLGFFTIAVPRDDDGE
jgi:hypothetical protein